MSSQSIISKSSSLIKGLLTITVIIYIGYTVGMSIYKNYTTNQNIDVVKQQINKLNDDIAEVKNLIYYYQTDSFREVEARRKLGMRGKGEQVIILPKPQERKIISPVSSELSQASEEQDITPNPTKWFNFILGR